MRIVASVSLKTHLHVTFRKGKCLELSIHKITFFVFRFSFSFLNSPWYWGIKMARARSGDATEYEPQRRINMGT